jgi:hypothetical protein
MPEYGCPACDYTILLPNNEMAFLTVSRHLNKEHPDQAAAGAEPHPVDRPDDGSPANSVVEKLLARIAKAVERLVAIEEARDKKRAGARFRS